MDIDEKRDKLVEVILYSSHICDFIWKRPDDTYYADRRRHNQKYVDVKKVDDKWVFKDD